MELKRYLFYFYKKIKKMATVQVKSQVSFHELLQALEQLNISDLEKISEKALAVRADQLAGKLTGEETRLFEIINRALPVEFHERLQFLEGKQQKGQLTPAEEDEGSALIKQIEEFENQRIEALIKLSKIKGVSIEKLRKQLGIPSHQ